MKKTTLWTPTRRELLLTGGISLLAGCGGSSSITPGATPTPNPTPTPGPNPTPTPSPTPIPSGRHERFGYIDFLSGPLGQLLSVRTDGTDARYVPIPSHTLPLAYVAWSRDGRRIAYSLFKTEKNKNIYPMYVMNADGSDHRGLGFGGELAWSPDGNRLGFNIPTYPSEGIVSTNYGAIDVRTDTYVLEYTGFPIHPITFGVERKYMELARPVWNGEEQLAFTFRAKDEVTATKEARGIYGIKILGGSGLLGTFFESEKRVANVYDFAPNDGLGLVTLVEAIGAEIISKRYLWIGRTDVEISLLRDGVVMSQFSPDGLRILGNLNNGKGQIIFDRDLNEVQVPVIPRSLNPLRWFTEA
jgi:hypothetical protein